MWAAAAAGLFLIVSGLHETFALREQIGIEEHRLSLPKAARAVAPVVARTRSPRETDAIREAARLASLTRHPWGDLMLAVESAAPPGVQWLRFEHSSDRSELRLEGMATNADLALRTVDALAGEPGWSSVVLTRLAANEASASATGLRFEIAARVWPPEAAAPASSEAAR